MSNVQPDLAKPARLVSLDAYRGFVMLAMASSGLALSQAASNPEVLAKFDGTSFAGVWKWLMANVTYHLSHVEWTGCAAWDLIQPSFMFMVGVAIPYSYARRRSLGDSYGKILFHTILRSFILIFLGVFLRSQGREMTNFTFEDVLSQIGMGYTFVFLLQGRGLIVQGLALIAILVGDWYLFFQHPLPPVGFDYSTVGAGEGHPIFTGYAAHWNKNTNFAHWFDAEAFGVGFLNLFPRAEKFLFNGGGYQTLNFIPSMATMLMGVMTGEMLRTPKASGAKLRTMIVFGLLCLALGMALDGTIWPYCNFTWTACPIVKKIWTPTWAIFSTGWTLLLLSLFYWLIDYKGWRWWAFPFVVVGMNSIVMYCMSYTMKGWISQNLRTHFGQELFSGPAAPVLERLTQLFVMWLICLWLYRQKIFIRI